MRFFYLCSVLVALSLNGFIPQPAAAAPNCPPKYINICKQLIKTLEDNNDGLHSYKWDGTHLIIDNNFAAYNAINHSSSDHTSGRVQTNYWDILHSRDYFGYLLNQVIGASKGGQTVYLHLHKWGTVRDTVSSLTLSPLAPPVPTKVPQAVPPMVPQPVPPKVPQARPNMVPPMVPQSVPKKVPQPLSPTGKAPNIKPKNLSVTYNVKGHGGQQIDKFTVNRHFVTGAAGSHIESESRAYLFDSNSDVWSCKVSGLLARRMPTSDGRTEIAGHTETLQFRSTHLAHIPGNHPMHRSCLISVQQ